MQGLPLVAESGGHSSSRCTGLSLSRPLLLWSTGSRRAGSVVVAHGPSCSAACGIFPNQGSNPCPLHWQADSEPLHHQGRPTHIFLILKLYIHILCILIIHVHQYTHMYRHTLLYCALQILHFLQIEDLWQPCVVHLWLAFFSSKVFLKNKERKMKVFSDKQKVRKFIASVLCTVKKNFFLIYLFICLFIYLWLCWVFISVRGLSLVVASGGHSSLRCAGLSLSQPLLLRSAGSVIVAHGPSCSAACGILPDQGLNPCPLHWQAASQPLRHQGSP